MVYCVGGKLKHGVLYELELIRVYSKLQLSSVRPLYVLPSQRQSLLTAISLSLSEL